MRVPHVERATLANDTRRPGESDEDLIYRLQMEGLEGAEATESARFYESEAKRLPGMTAEELWELDLKNPELVTLLTSRPNPAEMVADLDKEVDLSEIKAEGNQWFQIPISTADAAAFTALYPKLNEMGEQPPAVRVPRPYVPDRILEGWTRTPKAKFSKPEKFSCRMRGPFGAPCIGKYHTVADLTSHERHRHPNQFQARADELLMVREERMVEALTTLATRNENTSQSNDLLEAIRLLVSKIGVDEAVEIVEEAGGAGLAEKAISEKKGKG